MHIVPITCLLSGKDLQLVRQLKLEICCEIVSVDTDEYINILEMTCDMAKFSAIVSNFISMPFELMASWRVTKKTWTSIKRGGSCNSTKLGRFRMEGSWVIFSIFFCGRHKCMFPTVYYMHFSLVANILLL